MRGVLVRTNGRAPASGAAAHGVEALEKRCLLSACDLTSAQAAILAALPSGMQGQFAGSQLDLTHAATPNGATPHYVLMDPHPSLGATGRLAGFNASAPPGLSPAQLQHAYGIDNVKFGSVAGDGTGQTIAIVDAYDDPTIATDLQAFDQQFGLPAPPSFTEVNQAGDPTALPGTDPAGPGNSWAVEESLDVEWAHAVAPAAKIILVEANSASDFDLMSGAVGWARNAPGVSAVSMSFGEGENSGEKSFDSLFTTPSGHAGVTFLAATGDYGSPSGYPAYSPNVVAVGGTTLNVDAAGNVLSETGWSGSGGGVSVNESQPVYQQGIVTQSSASRANPDVSSDADPGTGVAVYDSYDFGSATPWAPVGGTSLATPCWAGLIALADQGRALNGGGSLDGATQTLPRLYSASTSSFRDITSGNNGGYSAGPGYDLVTGRGSPLTGALVPYLSAAGPYVSNFTPSGVQSTAPSSIDFNFSMQMDPTSFSVADDVDAFTGPGNADLRSSINGFSWLNNNTTLEVDFTQPTVQGPYTMTIGPNVLSATGSAMDQNQNGVNGEATADAFTGTFYYDLTPTQVLSTTPPAGGNVTPPFTTLDLHLSAACDPASVGASNLKISQGTVSAATLVDPTTVRYSLSGILRSGTISITLAQGALKDSNENPVLAFSGSYMIPTPPTPGAPTLLAATDSGISNSDGITNFDNSTAARAPQFSVSGTIVGDIVSIYADGTLIGSATATSQTTVVVGDGKTPIPTGVHPFTARQGPYGGEGVDSPATRLTILATAPSLSVAGQFDPTFNLTGVIVDPKVPVAGDGVLSVAIQPDGKILAGGDELSSDQTSWSPILARYTSQGQLDPTFGTNGFVRFASSGYYGDAKSIVLQSDGKIVLVLVPDGYLSIDPAVVRLNPNGTFDASFGSGGIATLDPDGNSDSTAAAVLIQQDGKLIVAGSIQQQAALFRLNSDGTLDTTYGSGGTGYVMDPVSVNHSYFTSACLEPNGDVVTTGNNIDPQNLSSVFAARVLSSGNLDTTFNGGGNVTPSLPSGDNTADGVALQTDGKVVLTAQTDSGVAILRLKADGSADAGFGTGGLVSLGEATISAPVIQSDGKIVVAGDRSFSNTIYGGFIDRMNADGSLDKTFNGTGQRLTQIGPSSTDNYFNTVAIQPDDNVIAGGVSDDPLQNMSVWTLVRVEGTTSSLALDPSSDSGISNADRVTNVTTPAFDVASSSTLYVRIYRDGALASSSFATGPTITLGAQSPGTHQYTMTVVDAAGNESTPTAPYSVTIDTTPPTVQLPAVASGPNAVNSVTITFSKPVYGLTLASLQLTRDGAAVPFTGAQTLTTGDNVTWVLGNLASLTGTPGSYQLTLPATPAVTDLAGNALSTGASTYWSLSQAITVTSVVVNGNNAALAGAQRSMVDSILYTFSQAVTLAATNAFTIGMHSGQTGTVPTLSWTAINPNSDGSSTQWAVAFIGVGVTGGSIADGVYDITLNAAAVTSDANPSVTVQPRATDTFYRLFGDAQGTGKVNSADYTAFLSTYGLKASGAGYLGYFADDGTTKIDSADYNAFLGNYGKKLSGFTATI